jgi:hypothetical protein
MSTYTFYDNSQQQQHQPPPSRGAMIDSCIAKFQELGINLLAIDFDKTILDVHTGGQWTGSLPELTEHVRYEFRQLIQACCEHRIHVAIVTYSGQTKLVRGVLEAMVGPVYANQIPIRGKDRSWSYQGQGSREGKQPFIASAVEELEHRIMMEKRKRQQETDETKKNAISDGEEQEVATANNNNDNSLIHKNTTLLIDDDASNIRCALADGTRAVWFNPNKPHHLLKDLARLV